MTFELGTLAERLSFCCMLKDKFIVFVKGLLHSTLFLTLCICVLKKALQHFDSKYNESICMEQIF